ncbi:MAG: hypothetical protein JNK82_25515 [Myxococcaceae bacterium]|nr:hypothetical protein [Myxococcaceae bacterium]
MSACVLPQNDDPLPVIPPQANRPPRIDPGTAVPALYQEVNVHPNCTLPTFTIAVRDPDVGPDERLRFRWLAYTENGVLGPVQINDLNSVLNTGAVFPVTAPVSLFMLTVLASTGKGRRLELIVADGELFTDSTGKIQTVAKTAVGEDGGQMANPTFYDTYSWTIDTVNANTCQ